MDKDILIEKILYIGSQLDRGLISYTKANIETSNLLEEYLQSLSTNSNIEYDYNYFQYAKCATDWMNRNKDKVEIVSTNFSGGHEGMYIFFKKKIN